MSCRLVFCPSALSHPLCCICPPGLACCCCGVTVDWLLGWVWSPLLGPRCCRWCWVCLGRANCGGCSTRLVCRKRLRLPVAGVPLVGLCCCVFLLLAGTVSICAARWCALVVFCRLLWRTGTACACCRLFRRACGGFWNALQGTSPPVAYWLVSLVGGLGRAHRSPWDGLAARWHKVCWLCLRRLALVVLGLRCGVLRYLVGPHRLGLARWLLRVLGGSRAHRWVCSGRAVRHCVPPLVGPWWHCVDQWVGCCRLAHPRSAHLSLLGHGLLLWLCWWVACLLLL